MSRVDASRPNQSLRQLLRQAADLNLPVEVPEDTQHWPVWPSDHPLRKYTCDKKKAYLHPEQAIAEAIASFRQSGLTLKVYPCPLGLHYHRTKELFWEEAAPA